MLENILENLKEIYRITRYELPKLPVRKRLNLFYSFVGLFSAIFLIAIMLVSHLGNRDKIVTYGFYGELLYLVAAIFAIVRKDEKYPNIIFGVNLFVLSSLSFFFRANEGIGVVWAFIILPLIMFIAGARYFFWYGLSYEIFIFITCYVPPIRRNLLTRYEVAFINVYPVIVFFEIIFIYTAMYQYYKKLVFQNEKIQILRKSNKQDRERNLEMALKSITTIVNAIEDKEEIAGRHSKRVAEFSTMIAEKLGLPEEQLKAIYNMALVHDVGKIAIPEELLRKEEKLTEDEIKEFKKHTEVGEEILKNLQDFPKAALVAKHHHERYDGKGYPSHLAGTNILLEARIVALADAFDYMNYNRPYRQAYSISYIRGELENGRGTQFDPDLVDIFIPICEENHWFRD